MPRQISDEEWNYYQGRTQVANFAESIFNDPALNKESRALVKRKYPNLDQGPYDTEVRVNERIDKLVKEREDEKKAAKDEADKSKWAKLRADTQSKYGFTDDGMKKLEELMVAENIGSYEAGALLLAQREPKSAEPTMDSQYWHHERADGFKEIAKDPEQWGRMEILNAIKRDEQRIKNGGR
jgi:hypothetical protein